MGIEKSIWHSKDRNLHTEAWHVEQLTGDATERELSDEVFNQVFRNMVAEGWNKDDAEEWLSAFSMDVSVIVSEIKGGAFDPRP